MPVLDHFPLDDGRPRRGTAADDPGTPAPGPPPPIHVEIHPPPAPVAPPPPAPGPQARRPTAVEWLIGFALAVALGVAADRVVRHEPIIPPAPLPEVLDALGRAYRATLATSYADAWDKAADDLTGGKTIAACQEELQATWKAAREQAFRARVGAAIVDPLKEGEEPADPAQRAAVAGHWRAFAKGLRGGR